MLCPFSDMENKTLPALERQELLADLQKQEALVDLAGTAGSELLWNMSIALTVKVLGFGSRA